MYYINQKYSLHVSLKTEILFSVRQNFVQSDKRSSGWGGMGGVVDVNEELKLL